MSWTFNYPTPNNPNEGVDINLTHTSTNHTLIPLSLGGIIYASLQQVGQYFPQIIPAITGRPNFGAVQHFMIVRTITGQGSNIITISSTDSALKYDNPPSNNYESAIIVLDQNSAVIGSDPIKGNVKNGGTILPDEKS